MHRRVLGTLLLVAALAAAGCDNDIENATQPTPPAPTTTDTFTGTININGAQTHTFVVTASGLVNATLTEAPEGVVVGLMLGTWNGAACATSIANDNAVKGNAVVGSATGVGTLCVRIHDVGKLTGPIAYTLTVEHP